MVYKGHVEKGAIVLDESIDLPEGAAVRIELAAGDSPRTADAPLSLADALSSVIGKAGDLPDDWSENHDEYLRDEHGQ